MAGYKATLDELSKIGGLIDGEAKSIDVEATNIGQSDISGGDFGRISEGIGKEYATAIDEKLVKGVQGFARGARAYSNAVIQSYKTYAATEESERSNLNNQKR
ncbi:hypothetical protein JOF53_005071 [Crossiella equi]|uniref:Excreted virulence factor EspC, type VII ESX diderm n=1 Tax=Crossiella equi TaxID=130796 RepID=A0ABS5AJ06_9PSEU|nr:hypothetical protein [Crossiella equi]MBP2476199.1 hypothetical protein [Crossiella equi]